MPNPPAETRLSATIMLLRDGREQLEVFMVQRHHQIDFATGALVFPGGKTDEADAAPELLAFCNGPEDRPSRESTVRIAAIRETFEECGVLLARPRGGSDLLDPARLAPIAKRYREPLQSGDRTMLDLVREEDLELAFDLLVPFAHWITPEFMPKRFDTHFFLVPAPPDQLAVHDGAESVDSLWTTIPEALDLEKRGERTIIFPTLENMKKLGRSRTVAEALESARRDAIVTVLPRIETEADGSLTMVLPEDAGYDTVRAPMEGLGGASPAARATATERT
jgi:8-oxo-dGTP pyrophosphatase MutT (NUDIX family)